MNKLSRRNVVYGAVLASLGAGGAFLVPRLAPAEDVLRPPGALAEKDFLATCIKCGQCLQVCPYHSVTLTDINHGLSMGSPVITPSVRGCYLCDLLPCVLSCPSGALDHAVSDARDVMMGKAEVTAVDRCLALSGEPVSAEDIAVGRDDPARRVAQTELEIELDNKLSATIGKPCRICVDFCPYPDVDSAIALVPDGSGIRPEIRDKCVGCGVCEELCPAKVITTKVR
jgi:ferredoxin-type protein NapG